MATAYDVAKHLLHLAAAEDEPEFLTHMRLQKLLYYCQGWSLVLRSQPLFSESIQAWAHGPVVRSVYAQFADHGGDGIAPRGAIGEGLSDDEQEFVEEVWNSYKQYSAFSLRQMTHREAPWREARSGYGPADRCEEEITHEAMHRFFSKYVEDDE